MMPGRFILDAWPRSARRSRAIPATTPARLMAPARSRSTEGGADFKHYRQVNPRRRRRTYPQNAIAPAARARIEPDLLDGAAAEEEHARDGELEGVGFKPMGRVRNSRSKVP